MKGSTGSGKTELARRLSQMANCPFIKVEATHYTEVGYYGKDVNSIIEDLVKMRHSKVQEEFDTHKNQIEPQLENYFNLLILDLLLGEDFKDTSVR